MVVLMRSSVGDSKMVDGRMISSMVMSNVEASRTGDIGDGVESHLVRWS